MASEVKGASASVSSRSSVTESEDLSYSSSSSFSSPQELKRKESATSTDFTRTRNLSKSPSSELKSENSLKFDGKSPTGSRRGAIQSVILTHQDVDSYLRKSMNSQSAPTSPPSPTSPTIPPPSTAPNPRRKSVAINFNQILDYSNENADYLAIQSQILAKKEEVEGSMKKGKFTSPSMSLFRRKTVSVESEKDKEKKEKKEQKLREKEEKKGKKGEKKEKKEKKSKKDKKGNGEMEVPVVSITPTSPPTPSLVSSATSRRGSTPEQFKKIFQRGMGIKSSSTADMSAYQVKSTSSNSLDQEELENSSILIADKPFQDEDPFMNLTPRTRERSSTTDSFDPESRLRILGLAADRSFDRPFDRSPSGSGNGQGSLTRIQEKRMSHSPEMGRNAVPRVPTTFSPKSGRSSSGDDVRPSFTQSVPGSPRKLSNSDVPSPLSNPTSPRRSMMTSSSSAAPARILHHRKSISEEGKRSVSFDMRGNSSALANLLALRPQTESLKKSKTGFESEVCEHHSVISKLTDYLLIHGTKTEGLFRISGSQQRINEMKKTYQKKGELELEMEDINNVASFLKMSARTAINPIVPHRLRPFFMKSKDLEEEEGFCISFLRGLLVRLPNQNYKILQKLVALCHQIYLNSEVTRMTLENLGTTIGPSIMPRKSSGSGIGHEALSDSSIVIEVVAFMIKNHLALFDKAAKVVFGVATALEDYNNAEKATELKFKKGDEIIVFERLSEQYYYGLDHTSKKFGYVVSSKVSVPQEMKLQEELESPKHRGVFSDASSLSSSSDGFRSLSKSPSSSTVSPNLSRSESLSTSLTNYETSRNVKEESPPSLNSTLNQTNSLLDSVENEK